LSNLTVVEFRQHFETDLPDPALQRVIDGVEAEIAAVIGAPGERTMTFTGGEPKIFFPQPVAAISAISETQYNTTTVLVPADYWLEDGGYWVARMHDGLAGRWGHRAAITFTPKPADARVKVATIDVTKIELQHNGVLYETAGSSQTQMGDWLKAKQRIISGLNRRIGVA